MTVSVVDAASGSAPPRVAEPDGARSAPAGRRAVRRPIFGVRPGQVVAAQAAAALLVAATGHGPLAVIGTALAAAALVLVAWVRLRRRWLYEWLGVGARYLTRRHTLAAAAQPAALLDLLAPGTHVVATELGGDDAAVMRDGYGLSAVLEFGDTGLLTEAQSLPSPASLLPAPSPETPPTRIQLLMAGTPAPALRAGGGTPATSYRQLTNGRLLGHDRALLAVRVLRAEGWSDEDLHRALSSLVRKVRRRVGPVPSRPLGAGAALRVIAELAQHDDAHPAREAWQAMHVGGLVQSTFHVRRWPDLRAETSRRLVPRLLALPAAATTVSLTAGPRASGDLVAVDLTVRLAATTPAGLSSATQALHRLLAAEGVDGRRLDGEHLAGLAATLPLAGGPSAPSPAPASGPVLSATTLDALDLPIGAAGLMLGADRHGAPVTARLFRPEPTRAMLVGGVRAAQLIALRAMALGARVVVQTVRPRAWEPFVRGVSTPGEAVAVIPPGRPVAAPAGNPLHPLLLVVDVGPVAADPQPGSRWQASLIVRDELAPADADTLARADLVLLQPLRADEAALAGVTLGLGEAAQWLTRIRDDMVGVVNRRAVRWAVLSATPIESQLIGAPTRH